MYERYAVDVLMININQSDEMNGIITLAANTLKDDNYVIDQIFGVGMFNTDSWEQELNCNV